MYRYVQTCDFQRKNYLKRELFDESYPDRLQESIYGFDLVTKPIQPVRKYEKEMETQDL